MRAAVLLFVVVGAAFGACPDGFRGASDDACFHVSPQKSSTFVECEYYCETLGGTLASVRDERENDFVRDLLGGKEAAYLGLFEAGEDESGDWRWVDGHEDSFRPWNPGEPNEWCTDEDCGVFAPGIFEGWVDASCTVRGWAKCLCRHGGEPVPPFLRRRPPGEAAVV